MIKRALFVGVLGIFLILSFCLFMKGFFPLKEGLTGFSTHDDVPNVPGLNDKSVPSAKYDRLIILVIDALREDFVFGEKHQMPFLRKIMDSQKGWSFSGQVHPPTVTLPRIKVDLLLIADLID